MSQFQNENSELQRIKLLEEISENFLFDETRLDIEENPTTQDLQKDLGKESPEIRNLRLNKRKIYLKLQKEILHSLDDYLNNHQKKD